MPEFAVELTDSSISLVVKLNKLPKRGSWFDLGDGTPAQAEEIRMIGGEPVIYAVKGSETDAKRRFANRKAKPSQLSPEASSEVQS